VLFIKDGLHMSDAGYAIWKELLTPLLEKRPVSR
jgi:lysophospholipase L1-like esterase